jgi:hypothetical protein
MCPHTTTYVPTYTYVTVTCVSSFCTSDDPENEPTQHTRCDRDIHLSRQILIQVWMTGKSHRDLYSLLQSSLVLVLMDTSYITQSDVTMFEQVLLVDFMLDRCVFQGDTQTSSSTFNHTLTPETLDMLIISAVYVLEVLWLMINAERQTKRLCPMSVCAALWGDESSKSWWWWVEILRPLYFPTFTKSDLLDTHITHPMEKFKPPVGMLHLKPTTHTV